MDKQPDKLDVLMDWFWETRSEIVVAMKQVKVEQAGHASAAGRTQKRT